MIWGPVFRMISDFWPFDTTICQKTFITYVMHHIPCLARDGDPVEYLTVGVHHDSSKHSTASPAQPVVEAL